MGHLRKGLKRKASRSDYEVSAKRVKHRSLSETSRRGWQHKTDQYNLESEIDEYQPSDTSSAKSTDSSDVEDHFDLQPHQPKRQQSERFLADPSEQEIATRARENHKRQEAVLKRLVDPRALKILHTVSKIGRQKFKRQQQPDTVDRAARRKLKAKFQAAVKKGFKVSTQPRQLYTFALQQMDGAPDQPRHSQEDDELEEGEIREGLEVPEDPQQPEQPVKRRAELIYIRDPERAEAIKEALYSRRNGTVMAAVPRAFTAIARDPWKPDYLNLDDVKKPYDRLLYTRALKHGQPYHRMPGEFTFDGVPKTKPSSSKYFSLDEDTHVARRKKRKQRADELINILPGAGRDHRPNRSPAAARSSRISASSGSIATQTTGNQESTPQSAATGSLTPTIAPITAPAAPLAAPTPANQPNQAVTTQPRFFGRRKQRESDEDIPKRSDPAKAAKLRNIWLKGEALKFRVSPTAASSSMKPPAARPDDSTRFKLSQPVKRPRPEEEAGDKSDGQPAKRARTSPVTQPGKHVGAASTIEPQEHVKTFREKQHEKRVLNALRGKENVPVAQKEKQTKTTPVTKPVDPETARLNQDASQPRKTTQAITTGAPSAHSQQQATKRPRPEDDDSTRSTKRSKPAASSGPPADRFGLSDNKSTKARGRK
ncbi:hypothetical protein SLS60_000392 [Paraconiothyrium brasiliense]|uniref:Uncharacterized protein n=1 Tax=Paraconiothyrium brasiliense TaxID=300254 RepID=A0ABR3S6P7_9PLEO